MRSAVCKTEVMVIAAPADELALSCGGAPMMVINGHYHERLTLEKVDELLDGLE